MGYFSQLHAMIEEAGYSPDCLMLEGVAAPKQMLPKKVNVKKVKWEDQCCKCDSKGTRSSGRTKYCLWHWCEPGAPGSY